MKPLNSNGLYALADDLLLAIGDAERVKVARQHEDFGEALADLYAIESRLRRTALALLQAEMRESVELEKQAREQKTVETPPGSPEPF